MMLKIQSGCSCTGCGSVPGAASQLFQPGSALPSSRTDLFSMAVLFSYVLLGWHPLDGRREGQQVRKVVKETELPFDEEAKLVYGVVFSLRNMVKKLAGR